MKPFLKELAETIAGTYGRADELTIVFPNRRASLFFQKYYAESITSPSWSPSLLSIEEFFSRLSDLKEPDKLSLIFTLYEVYNKVMKVDEPFDRFYFWGEMLLRDFDEVDKYLVNASQLFRDLSKLKELDETFDYLTEEQKEFLRSFWISFEEKPVGSKEEFLRVWRKLTDVYAVFVKTLKKEGNGYEGLLHREVLAKLQATSLTTLPWNDYPFDKLIFAGFNALTKAEEGVLAYFVARGANVFWDCDAYYLNNRNQEAGQFMREYRNHTILGRTFPKEVPSNITQPKNIKLTGVAQRIGQAKHVGQVVGDWLKNSGPVDLEKTVIVLPDEGMLLPMMNSLPDEATKVNVTMGYPLRLTPLFNLLDLVIEMQIYQKENRFSHRQVTTLLDHPYLISLTEKKSQEWRREIISGNKVYVAAKEFGSNPVFDKVFKVISASDASGYLLELVEMMGSHFAQQQGLDREYAFHFHRHLSRLHEILTRTQRTIEDQSVAWRGFQKLFRQVIQSQRIPFTGEPLKGLQIMGVMETRNLDFDNVYMLSLNEGMLPAPSRQGSYIPHSIRKAYALPAFEHQDAFYAYLFYRLLQRADTIHLYYNTEPDIIGNGEMSRYLQQLIYESGLKIDKQVLHLPLEVSEVTAVTVNKTPEVMQILDQYLEGAANTEAGEKQKFFSPTALNDYIECRLRFYLKHLAKLYEAEEVEEEFDARMFGNLLHDVLAWQYEPFKREGKQVTVEDTDRLKKNTESLIDKAYRRHFRMDAEEAIVYEGQRLVVKEMISDFVNKVLDHDKTYTPFHVDMLEERFIQIFPIASGKRICVGGTIDRVDEKDNVIRVVDYKTGRDDTDFESIPSLFAREGKRNKAAFQTFLYSYVYGLRNPEKRGDIKPGLYHRKKLFSSDFEFGHTMGKSRQKEMVEDAKPYFFEFAEQLNELLTELYDVQQPFDQTANEKACMYCSFKSICRR